MVDMQKLIFNKCLTKGTTYVVVHADAPGVEIPTYCRRSMPNQPNIIRLDYGLTLPVPILDLEVTDEGIRATLSFNREPHKTFVPWTAVLNIGLADQSFVASWSIPAQDARTTPPPSTPSAPTLRLVP